MGILIFEELTERDFHNLKVFSIFVESLRDNAEDVVYEEYAEQIASWRRYRNPINGKTKDEFVKEKADEKLEKLFESLAERLWASIGEENE